MIRVVHVLGSLDVGGVESFILSIYRKIDREKIQFDFIVHKLENHAYKQEIENLGGRIFLIDKIKIQNPLKYIRDIDSILTNHKDISILHCHFRGSESIILKRAKKLGLTTISHNHGLQTSSNIKTFIRNILKKDVIRYSDYKFACSDEVGEEFYGKGNYTKINNGIDINKYIFDEKIREKARKDLYFTDEIVLINVASHTEVKNQEFLIRLLPDLLEREEGLRLLLVGEGKLSNYYKNLCKQLGIENEVIFLGNSDRVNQLLMAADLFLFPSIREGLGIAAIEAQASGLNCILSQNVPKEVAITDGVRFLEFDKAKWTDAIIDMKDWPRKDNRKEIKKAGYDINTSLEYLTDIYQKNGR